MADTADRRSEGRTNTPTSKMHRDRYMRLKSLGLCGKCGSAGVANRAICYTCSDQMQKASRLSHLRLFMEQVMGERRPDPDQYTDEDKIFIATELMKLCK